MGASASSNENVQPVNATPAVGVKPAPKPAPKPAAKAAASPAAKAAASPAAKAAASPAAKAAASPAAKAAASATGSSPGALSLSKSVSTGNMLSVPASSRAFAAQNRRRQRNVFAPTVLDIADTSSHEPGRSAGAEASQSKVQLLSKAEQELDALLTEARDLAPDSPVLNPQQPPTPDDTDAAAAAIPITPEPPVSDTVMTSTAVLPAIASERVPPRMSYRARTPELSARLARRQKPPELSFVEDAAGERSGADNAPAVLASVPVRDVSPPALSPFPSGDSITITPSASRVERMVRARQALASSSSLPTGITASSAEPAGAPGADCGAGAGDAVDKLASLLGSAISVQFQHRERLRIFRGWSEWAMTRVVTRERTKALDTGLGELRGKANLRLLRKYFAQLRLHRMLQHEETMKNRPAILRRRMHVDPWPALTVTRAVIFRALTHAAFRRWITLTRMRKNKVLGVQTINNLLQRTPYGMRLRIFTFLKEKALQSREKRGRVAVAFITMANSSSSSLLMVYYHRWERWTAQRLREKRVAEAQAATVGAEVFEALQLSMKKNEAAFGVQHNEDGSYSIDLTHLRLLRKEQRCERFKASGHLCVGNYLEKYRDHSSSPVPQEEQGQPAQQVQPTEEDVKPVEQPTEESQGDKPISAARARLSRLFGSQLKIPATTPLAPPTEEAPSPPATAPALPRLLWSDVVQCAASADPLPQLSHVPLTAPGPTKGGFPAICSNCHRIKDVFKPSSGSLRDRVPDPRDADGHVHWWYQLLLQTNNTAQLYCNCPMVGDKYRAKAEIAVSIVAEQLYPTNPAFLQRLHVARGGLSATSQLVLSSNVGNSANTKKLLPRPLRPFRTFGGGSGVPCCDRTTAVSAVEDVHSSRRIARQKRRLEEQVLVRNAVHQLADVGMPVDVALVQATTCASLGIVAAKTKQEDENAKLEADGTFLSQLPRSPRRKSKLVMPMDAADGTQLADLRASSEEIAAPPSDSEVLPAVPDEYVETRQLSIGRRRERPGASPSPSPHVSRRRGAVALPDSTETPPSPPTDVPANQPADSRQSRLAALKERQHNRRRSDASVELGPYVPPKLSVAEPVAECTPPPAEPAVPDTLQDATASRSARLAKLRSRRSPSAELLPPPAPPAAKAEDVAAAPQDASSRRAALLAKMKARQQGKDR